MKTYKNLYSQIYTFENLHTAYRRARKGKRSRVEVAAFEFDMEQHLLQLQSELRDQTYRPGPYHNFYIREPKRRLAGVGFARLHLRRRQGVSRNRHLAYQP